MRVRRVHFTERDEAVVHQWMHREFVVVIFDKGWQLWWDSREEKTQIVHAIQVVDLLPEGVHEPTNKKPHSYLQIDVWMQNVDLVQPRSKNARNPTKQNRKQVLRMCCVPIEKIPCYS